MKTRALTQEQFLAAVRKAVPDITDERDAEVMDLSIIQNFEDGWTVSESAAYSRTFEEVCPEREEDEALRHRAQIVAAVKVRQGKD